MPTIRDLEDLIIDAIYLDILRGKLDQKEQQLEIEYTMGRDLEPGKVESVLSALQNWCAHSMLTYAGTNYIRGRASTTAAVLHSLDTQLNSLAQQSAANEAAAVEHEKSWQSTLKDIQDKQKKDKWRRPLGPGGNSSIADAMKGGGNTRDDPMDVDDVASESKGKNRK